MFILLFELSSELTILTSVQFSSVQSFSRVQLFETPWIIANQDSLFITNSQSLLKLMPIESVMPSSHLILCHPLLLLPPIPPSIRVFSNESALRIRWPKYWNFSFSISPFKEYLVLISFRMDWLDLLAVQGTLKNLLQHHCSKASIFFFFNMERYGWFLVLRDLNSTGKILNINNWQGSGLGNGDTQMSMICSVSLQYS